MNGGKRAAAGKLTPLITSQQRPVLEVAFKARAGVFLSVLAPPNQVGAAAAEKINRKDEEKRRYGREEDAQECRKVEKRPKKEDEEKKGMKTEKEETFRVQPPTSSTSSCPRVCSTEAPEQANTDILSFLAFTISTSKGKRRKDQ